MPQSQAFTKLQSASERIIVRAVGGFTTVRTGTTNISVLNFANNPTVNGVVAGQAEYVTAANSATLGSSVVLRMPGIYTVQFFANIVADALIPIFGISQDVAAAGLTTAPSFATAGFFNVQPPVVAVATAAGCIIPVNITSSFEVTDRQAAQVAGGVTGSIIRFHAATSGPATPGAGVEQATGYFEIRRTGPAFASS